jgi:hypothetical protein
MVSVLASSAADLGIKSRLDQTKSYHKRVSEWLLFNANSAIFQLIFNEMMMRSTLYLNNTLSWISVVASSMKSPHSDASS